MPFTLTGTQPSGPLYVSLASGDTVRLGPGETSVELPDGEVEDSPAVRKLQDRGLLEVRPVDQRGGPRSRGVRRAAAKDDTTDDGSGS